MATALQLIRRGKLGTSLRHGELYIFASEYDERAVHILDAEGKSWCNIGNTPSAKILDATSSEVPLDRGTCEPRKVCTNCTRRRALATNPRFKCEAAKAFYGSRPWARLRFETFRAYGRTCMLCGSKANLVVDHIKPRSKFPELQLDPENVQILCNMCNIGKTDVDMSDFRWTFHRQRYSMQRPAKFRLTAERVNQGKYALIAQDVGHLQPIRDSSAKRQRLSMAVDPGLDFALKHFELMDEHACYVAPKRTSWLITLSLAQNFLNSSWIPRTSKYCATCAISENGVMQTHLLLITAFLCLLWPKAAFQVLNC